MPSAKMASLTALCVHYSVLTIVLHLSRTSSSSPSTSSSSTSGSGTTTEAGGSKYKASSAVVVTEIGKLVISLVLAARQVRRAIEEEREEARRQDRQDGRFLDSVDDLGTRKSSEEKPSRQVSRPPSMRSASYTHGTPHRPLDEDHPLTSSTSSNRSVSSARGRKSVADSPLPFRFGHGRTSSANFNLSVIPPTPERSNDDAPGDKASAFGTFKAPLPLALDQSSARVANPRLASSLPASPTLPSPTYESFTSPSSDPHPSSTNSDRSRSSSWSSHHRTPSLPYTDFPPPSPSSPSFSLPPPLPSYSSSRLQLRQTLRRLKGATFAQGWWKLGVPAGMFVVQNNLQYVAASHLSVSVFQITYQLKVRSSLSRVEADELMLFQTTQILTTALCSVVLLRRTLYRSQWIALFVLTLGVALVQLYQSPSPSSPPPPSPSSSSTARSVLSDPKRLVKRLVQPPPQGQMVGLVAVVLACLSSGFASVYFERVLKNPGPLLGSPTASTTFPPSRHHPSGPVGSPQRAVAVLRAAHVEREKRSLWIRNVQLSVFGLVIGLSIFAFEGSKDRLLSQGQAWGLWSSDGLAPESGPTGVSWLGSGWSIYGVVGSFFQGFTPLVWLVVSLQILGGLLNALVISHADNIAKGFATAVSILLSTSASVVLFGETVGSAGAAGAGLVIGATWLYNQPQARLPHKLGWFKLTDRSPSVSVSGSATSSPGNPSPGLSGGRAYWTNATEKATMGNAGSEGTRTTGSFDSASDASHRMDMR